MRILLFCDFQLPDSCANASRVFNLAEMLRGAGHSIDVLGVKYSKNGELGGTYKNFKYDMLQTSPYYGIRAGKRIRDLADKIQAYLSKHTGENKYDVIILSNIYYDHSKVFVKYSKSHGASLVVNAVEWYDINNTIFKGVLGKINLVKNRIALRCIHKKMGNILAISSLLDEYYKKRGCNTVTVPTIVDPNEYALVRNTERPERDKIVIAYAGVPGKKDYVINAVKALGLLSDEERERIELHFYGPTADYFATSGIDGGAVAKYKDNVFCHGRIPYDEVKHRIAKADFTVLLRPDKRYANAGFPTKVGESIACGTPVIANITSDLGKYIIDGETGFVCENESPKACADAFRKVLSLSVEQRGALRIGALKCAEEHFYYASYKDAVNSFLNSSIGV